MDVPGHLIPMAEPLVKGDMQPANVLPPRVAEEPVVTAQVVMLTTALVATLVTIHILNVPISTPLVSVIPQITPAAILRAVETMGVMVHGTGTQVLLDVPVISSGVGVLLHKGAAVLVETVQTAIVIIARVASLVTTRTPNVQTPMHHVTATQRIIHVAARRVATRMAVMVVGMEILVLRDVPGTL